MTRYQKHMQRIHDVSTATTIEAAVMLLTEDIADYLVKSGVKPDSRLIKEIRTFKDYEYNPKGHIKSLGNHAGINKL